jgi:hypothetical protein
MANVTTYLNKIKSAIYGKDVRQSIHDAISAINTQVETYSSAETSRVSAEKTRVSNENSRKSAETSRKSTFSTLEEQAETLIEEMQEVIDQGMTFAKIYPVGSIYLSVSSTDPSTLFGGTWEAWGTGRVPVGIDTSDTDFATVEKTGGSKNLQSHTHTFTGTAVTVTGGAHSHTLPYPAMAAPDTDSEGQSYNAKFGWYDPQSEEITETDSATHSHTFTAKGTISSAGSGNAQNLQPYITCYMWKRTA